MSDKPRFYVSAMGMNIYDEDFHYDARLALTGDFPNDEERLAYAQAVADALNKAKVPGGKHA